MADILYFDNNATTKLAPEARAALEPFLGELVGNPSSAHNAGGRILHAVEKAREQVALMLGCEAGEIVFNSGGTEGLNTAIENALDALPARKQIIISKVEHSAVSNVVRPLARKGYRITEINVDRLGRLDLAQLNHELGHETALVATLWANNETGVVAPMAEIGDMAKRAGAMLVVDAVQCPGKLKLDMKAQSAIDYLAVSGHKFHALPGAGALFVRKGAPYRPLIRGGNQERGRRAGTENVPGIVSMGAAARCINEHLEADIRRQAELRDMLQSGLLARLENVIVNGDEQARLCNTLNVGFEFVEAEAVLLMLDAAGVAASSGSACESGSLETSHVLRAMGVPFTAIHGSVRFSLSRYTTAAEVEAVIERTVKIVRRLREISPFGRDRPAPKKPADLEAHKAYFASA
ncbi:aminotransferase class V-fold PLP-dependent enzyme [bacterium]|nr:MAG: aminotransferase class V-fold PLP-dependent enzyme [bacterium]